MKSPMEPPKGEIKKSYASREHKSPNGTPTIMLFRVDVGEWAVNSRSGGNLIGLPI